MSFACVDQNTVQVVERCGQFAYMADPGCHFINCFIGEKVRGALSMRVQQLDVSVETKTKDNVFVHVNVTVQYQVMKTNLREAFYTLTDSQRQIKAYIFDTVRSTVPNIALDKTFDSKDDIALSVKAELTKAMTTFGFQIIQTLVTDIAPDNRVKHAMNLINASERARAAANDKAEAEKIMVVKAAEADAEAKFLSGTGIARQRQAIINGLRESVGHFQQEVKDINSKQVMDLMLVTQYFDMLKEVGTASKQTSVFIPHGPGAIADTALQLRGGLLSPEQ